jgi:microcompartment protein CcmK/EutM
LFYAKVVGTVTATLKDKSLYGKKLLIIEPVDCRGDKQGDLMVAVDTVQAGFGDLVFYAKSKDAALAMENPNTPVDSVITGIIDSIYKTL